LSGNFKIRLRGAEGEEFSFPPHSARPLEIGARLYLTLGGRIPDLQDGLRVLAPRRAEGEGDANTTWPRFAAYEDDVALLPQHGFSYDAVDLVILATDNAKFLTALQADAARIKALSQWVQRGGRLIISVAPNNQELVHALLQS